MRVADQTAEDFVSENEFGQIIVGAGMAGLCCAGELVLHGERPLLISETKEVGAIFRLRELGENSRYFMQHTTRQLGWGGGWWYTLAQKLNVPIRLSQGIAYSLMLQGTGVVSPLAQPGSGAAFCEMVSEAFGVPLDEETSKQLSSVIQDALAIPPETLYTMNREPLAQWLAEHGAGEFVTTLVLTFCGFPNDLTLETAREHLSVFGGLATMRILLCGEGNLPIVHPSPRDGLLIPLAKEIEARGGTISRGRRVARVLIEDGHATGVALEDGTELRSSVVAIATGNGRIRTLLDPLPEELVEPMEYSSSISLYDFNTFFLLDRPMLQPDNRAIAVFDPATLSVRHWVWPLTGVAPWTTEPGKQLVGAHTALMAEDLDARGGPEGVYADLLSRTEEMVPGFTDAIVDRVNHSPDGTGSAWLNPLTVGPKIPRTIESVDGLWFVGDGSGPCAGIWSEAAASCGILGARAMCDAPVGGRS